VAPLAGQRHPFLHRPRQLERGVEYGRLIFPSTPTSRLAGARPKAAAAEKVHHPIFAQLVAVEPEGYLRRLAVEAAESAPVPVRVIDGLASSLPVDEAAFDAGVLLFP
jgi:hypothetical protein